jgi:Fucose 4-O-acetylase and related acetyltransferases
MEKGNRIRVYWIDLLKAGGMFLVILGHAASSITLKKMIYSFHMPLFFIVSGYTWRIRKEVNLKEFVERRVTGLIIPYFVINLVFIPIWSFLVSIGKAPKQSLLETIIGIIYGNNLGSYNSTVTVTWFLLTLFISEIIFYLVCKYSRNEKWKFCLVSIIASVGFIFSVIAPETHLMWHFDVALVGCSLIYIGDLFMVNADKLKNIIQKKGLTITIVIIMAIVCLGIAYVNRRVSLVAHRYGNVLYFYSAAVGLTTAGALLSMLFPRVKMLENVGKNTLLYLAIHDVTISIVYYYLPAIQKSVIYYTSFSVILFLALIPVCYVINKLLGFLKAQKLEQKLLNSIFHKSIN